MLGIGDYLELGALYLRLIDEGHEVRVFVAEDGAHDVLAGMVPRTASWEHELAWVRDAGDDGLILFEDAGRGELQDRLRGDGFHVLGGSALGDRLELDRDFGQACLREVGLATAPVHRFTDFDAAIGFIAAHPRRYVLKFDDSYLTSDANYVGMRDDGADVRAIMTRYRRQWRALDEDPPPFILMHHVTGVEVGVGSFFDGERFVGPINLDWEHKRLFPGELGELTGEMGTVVSYRGGERLFEATLARLAPRLRAGRHVGYVNLNTIVNADGVWPLELTCRFGYPGFAILSALFAEPCGEILARMARGGAGFATHPGFAVGVVLTVPPFPYHHGYDELGKGTPICLPAELSADDRRHLHFAEVGLVDGELVTTGLVGYVMVVTGRGDSVEAAQRAAYALAGRIAIPNVRYRVDIGDGVRTTGLATLAKLGWL
ncbi:MAG TPA: phosphoribosylglycinamide synthetase C domain-containing protein [Kofleriaceae bacterium]|nr:phosphoribosylglycinamide synthetase C domain-containing protein [Kofleriaceae bacterium]